MVLKNRTSQSTSEGWQPRKAPTLHVQEASELPLCPWSSPAGLWSQHLPSLLLPERPAAALAASGWDICGLPASELSFPTFSGPLGAQPRNATRLSHPQQTWCAPPPTVQSPLPSPVLTTASSVHSCPFSPYSLPLVVHFTPSLPRTQAEPLAEPGALSTSPLSSQPFKPALRNE